jgi:hypothetical protein
MLREGGLTDAHRSGDGAQAVSPFFAKKENL